MTLSLVLQKRNLKHLGQVQMVLDGTPGPFVAQPNLAGQQVLAAYALIPSLGWAVLVERPASAAYAPLYGLTRNTTSTMLHNPDLCTRDPPLVACRTAMAGHRIG